MYSEEIKHSLNCSDTYTCENKLRNTYFENRSCLSNVFDFLNQEVIIIPREYFSYPEGTKYMIEDQFLYYDYENNELFERICSIFDTIETENGYHLCVLDDYLSIVAYNKRCIFTNKNMKEGKIIGTIIWVKNFNELLNKYEEKCLKRVSNAIVHAYHNINEGWDQENDTECLDLDFFLSMEIYKPETIFRYTIDSYKENICIDVYNELVKINLNSLVDKYTLNYVKCDGYGEKGEKLYSTKLCKCGRLRALCYLDM